MPTISENFQSDDWTFGREDPITTADNMVPFADIILMLTNPQISLSQAQEILTEFGGLLHGQPLQIFKFEPEHPQPYHIQIKKEHSVLVGRIQFFLP